MLKNAYGFIYITTNDINGKKYIGQKVYETNNHKHRWETYLGSGITLKKAIKKYGNENFTREIVAEDENYYNIAIGGQGGFMIAKFSEEEKRKIYDKIGKANKGKSHPNTEKQKELISLSKIGKPRLEETKYKISETMKGKYTGNDSIRFKEVICLTTGVIFHTIKQGSEYYKCHIVTVGNCCRHKFQCKTAGKLEDGTKLTWMFYEEYINNQQSAL